MGRGRPGLSICLFVLVLSSTGGGATAGSSWGLPYDIRPLIQQGSGNLLQPIAGAPGSRAWQLNGGAQITFVDGEPALNLAPGDGFSVRFPLAGGRLYVLEMEFQFAPDTVFAPTSDELGLTGWVEPLAPGERDLGAYLVGEVRLLPGWQQHRSFFYAGDQATEGRISLGLSATKGGVSIRRISLREVQVGAGAGLSVVDTGNDQWAELPREQEPPGPPAAVFYHRRDPDRLFPWSAPTEEELGQPIVLTGTPGEVLIAAAGLYTPTTLENLMLTLSELKSADGRALGAKFEWFEVRYAPRKTNYYGRGRTFRLVADSLWARPTGATAMAGQTSAFWLRVTIPEGAAPGDYRGTLTADSPAGPHALPVHLRVLPFTLVDPAWRTWGLYADCWRWTERTDQQVARELSEMKAHGIDSLLLETSVGDPVWDGARVVGWRLSPELDRAVPMTQRAGLRGPLLIEWWQIEDRLAQHLGVDPEVMQRRADTWPAKVGTAYLEALRAFDKEWRARGWGKWVYVGLDEPGYWKPGSPELFRFQYDAAAEAGLLSYCTSSDLPSDPIGRPLTYHCVGSRFAEAPTIAGQFRREAKQHGQHIWFYASGSYDAQAGNLLSNRWITGFLYYKSGAEGTFSWTFQRPEGPNPLDDFFRRESQPCITYADPEHPGEDLDTPHWEAIRQGWYDYRYAATLAQAIHRAREQPERRARAEHIQRQFSQLLDSMPWGTPGASLRQETNLTCDEWRQKIAEMIEELSVPVRR